MTTAQLHPKIHAQVYAQRRCELARTFCPRCGALHLAATGPCPGCGLHRPAARLAWQPLARLDADLLYDPLAAGDSLWCLTAAELVELDRFELRVRQRLPLQVNGALATAASGLAVDANACFVGLTLAGERRLVMAALARQEPGQVRWQHLLHPSLNVSAPTLAAGVLYFAASNGEAWAVEAASGAVLWRRPLPAWSPEAPVVAGDLVLFATRSPQVVAKHRATGADAWVFRDPQVDAWLAWAPAVYGEQVAVVNASGKVHLLHLADGAPVHAPFLSPQGALFFTAPVAAALDAQRWLLLVAAKDHGLYAVDGDGAVAWRYDAGGTVRVPLLVLDDEVYAFSRSNKLLHALDLRTGQPLAEPTATPQTIEQGLATDGYHVLGVGKHGLVMRTPRAAPVAGAPDAYLRRGRAAQAVAALAAAGALRPAAERCLRDLHDPAAAAQLYAAAGALAQAADAYQAAGELAQAEALYAELENWAAAGTVAVQAERLLEAAGYFEQAGDWNAAADLYARLGQQLLAGELYTRGGNLDAAQAAFSAAGAWRRAAEACVERQDWLAAAGHYARGGEAVLAEGYYRQAQRLDLAAALWAAAGEAGRAGALWEEQGDAAAAMAAYRTAGEPALLVRALALCTQVGDWRMQCELLVELGRSREAAALAHAQAVAHEQATRGAAETELAALFELALDYCTRAGLDSSDRDWNLCQQKVRYYHRWPDLFVTPQPEKRPFRVGHVSPLRVQVKNVGRGAALDVKMHLTPVLDAVAGDLAAAQSRISERYGKWTPTTLHVEPAKPGLVTLVCTLTYRDRRGGEHSQTERWEIEVVGGLQTGTQVINIYDSGQLVQAGGNVTQVAGDWLQDDAQKGDRVVIGRRQLNEPFAAQEPKCAHCNTILAAGAAFCDSCGEAIDFGVIG